MLKDKKLRKQLLIVSSVVIFILALDQIIKIYVKTHFEPNVNYSLLGEWFVMDYIENQGMAFGTTFGSKAWHKLALSIFRMVAITGIGYYWYRQAKKGGRLEFLLAIGLVFAGASGNLIDSIFYDFIFPFDPCMQFNYLQGSGIEHDCGWGVQEVRNSGFLMGNVVDMFRFDATWPSWLPWLGGKDVFPAVWNIADASITLGVIMVFIRQRTYFPKKVSEATAPVETEKASSSSEEA